MNINEQLWHDHLSCSCASINWHEIHKKLCQTIYITQMENKNTKHKYIRDVQIAYIIQFTCITHGNCTDDTNSRDYYLQKEHVSMETDKWADHMFHIMIQAKFMSLLHVMYNIYSKEPEYTKIICTWYDYHI